MGIALVMPSEIASGTVLVSLMVTVEWETTVKRLAFVTVKAGARIVIADAQTVLVGSDVVSREGPKFADGHRPTLNLADGSYACSVSDLIDLPDSTDSIAVIAMDQMSVGADWHSSAD